jgi:5-methylcytosine-specific restriction endonuclease McrA
MNISTLNPVAWRLDTLLSLGTDHVHELARVAAGSLTSFRLVLGRCLLALQESGGYKEFGCSSAVHYGTQILGLPKREARACRRVARELQFLPDLSLAAELGRVEWSKLREVVRKATPHTESYWLELADRFNSDQIQALVTRTPKGSIPGEAAEEEELATTELRCPVSPRVFRMLAEARRLYSVEQEAAVTNADILEMALVSYIAGRPVDADVLEKARQEADKDLQAQEARRLPLVQEARDLAEERGLLGDPDSSEEEPDAEADDVSAILAQALGTGSIDDELTSCGEGECGCQSDDSKYPERPTWVAATPRTANNSKVPNGLKLPNQTWTNKRLSFNPEMRLSTKAQRKEILRRDGWCCQTPGCPNKVWLHIHHLKGYAEGGQTVPENLISLCSGCHRNLHDGILRITLAPNGELIFSDKNGERLDRRADLELAGWLDRWHGWRGEAEDSHYARAHLGDWKVFA